jgi:hypothetical protein
MNKPARRASSWGILASSEHQSRSQPRINKCGPWATVVRQRYMPRMKAGDLPSPAGYFVR